MIICLVLQPLFADALRASGRSSGPVFLPSRMLAASSRTEDFMLFFLVSTLLEEMLESGESRGRMDLFWVRYPQNEDGILFRVEMKGDYLSILVSEKELQRRGRPVHTIDLLEISRKANPENGFIERRFNKALLRIGRNPHVKFSLKKTARRKKPAARRIRVPDWKAALYLGFAALKGTVLLAMLAAPLSLLGLYMGFDLVKTKIAAWRTGRSFSLKREGLAVFEKGFQLTTAKRLVDFARRLPWKRGTTAGPRKPAGLLTHSA
jgi:hypothetical protein